MLSSDPLTNAACFLRRFRSGLQDSILVQAVPLVGASRVDFAQPRVSRRPTTWFCHLPASGIMQPAKAVLRRHPTSDRVPLWTQPLMPWPRPCRYTAAVRARNGSPPAPKRIRNHRKYNRWVISITIKRVKTSALYMSWPVPPMSEERRVTTITLTEILYRSGRCPCHPTEDALRSQQRPQLGSDSQFASKANSRTSSHPSQRSSRGCQSSVTTPSSSSEQSTETWSDPNLPSKSVKRRPWSWLRRTDSRSSSGLA